MVEHRGVHEQGGDMRFEVHTQRREQMVDVTREIRTVVQESGVRSGRVLVYCPHTTAAVTINEAADPDVPTDILKALAAIAAVDVPWAHQEGNSDAHVKATLVGASADIPVIDGKLALGTWQGVFLCEFDGPRRRSLTVSVCAG